MFADKVEAYKEAENWSGYAGDILPLTLTANEGATGEYWTTYYNNLAHCKAPEGTEVFKVALDGSSLELTEIDDRIITQGEGVVLKSNSADIPLYSSATGSTYSYGGNSLQGTMTRITNPGNAYVLNKKSAGVGFYKLSATGNIGAHKAYLTYDGSSGAREFMPFDDDPTGIVESEELRVSFAIGNGAERSERKCEESDDAWYDLSGRKYDKRPAKPGLYIHKGEKVMIN